MIDDAVVGARTSGGASGERNAAKSDSSVSDVVLEASREMRSPLAYATLIALLAVVPVVVMEGRPGAFFEPLAIAYALAVAAAMLVALTLTPALSLILFSWGSVGPGVAALHADRATLQPRSARGPLTAGNHRRRRCGGVAALAFALQNKS